MIPSGFLIIGNRIWEFETTLRTLLYITVGTLRSVMVNKLGYETFLKSSILCRCSIYIALRQRKLNFGYDNSAYYGVKFSKFDLVL